MPPRPIEPADILDGMRRYACYAAPFLAGIGLRAGPAYITLLLPAAALLGSPACQPPQYPPLPPPGIGLPIKGGQCFAFYRVTVVYRITNADSCQVVASGTDQAVVRGPLSFITESTNQATTNCAGPTATVIKNEYLVVLNGTGGREASFGGGWPALGDYCYVQSVVRLDGQPDNCGDGPIIPYPNPPKPIPYPDPPRDPDGNPYVPSPDPPIYLPIPTGPGLPPIVIPIGIGPLILSPNISFPISVPISISGSIVGYGIIAIDGSVTFIFNGEGIPLDEIFRRLKRIEECACAGEPGPPVEIENLLLPVLPASPSTGCDSETITLEVKKGTYTPEKAAKVTRTITEAVEGCKAKNPEQKQETRLGFGSVEGLPQEQFVAIPDKAVYSLRIRMTSWTKAASPITQFAAANQRKFGFVAVSNASGRSGDPVYIYDEETYIVLPKSPGTRYLRLLLATGTSWEVYDTGERVGI